MSSQDWMRIALALAAVGGLVLLITRLRVNAFVALVLVSLLVGGLAGFLGQPHENGAGPAAPYTLRQTVKSLQDGIGATLGGIAAILALGSMLGKLLEVSGGAEVLAQRFAATFRPERAQVCIVVLAFLVGLTTWFTVGLLLLLPILTRLTHASRQDFLRLALPLLATLSVLHGLTPPHPGPVVAADAFAGRTTMGLMLLWGLVIGVPTAMVAGPGYARWLTGCLSVPPPAPSAAATSPAEHRPRPGFSVTLLTLLLPVGLMLLATLADLTLPRGDRVREWANVIGNPTLALLISVLLAGSTLGKRCGFRPGQLLKFSEESVAAIGLTVLVVGAGGGLARVLRDSGVADSVARLAISFHLPPILYAWLVAAFIRVAVGSATVAITTASGLLTPILASHPEYGPHQVALILVAAGCGSIFLSHLNDAGFWIVKDCLGLTVGQTFRTWSVCETIIGLCGLMFCLLAFAVLTV